MKVHPCTVVVVLFNETTLCFGERFEVKVVKGQVYIIHLNK